MQAAGSSETVLNLYQTAWQHIPGDIIFHILSFILSSIPFTGSNDNSSFCGTAAICVGPGCLQASLCDGFGGLAVLAAASD
jgi:hypothetical protein